MSGLIHIYCGDGKGKTTAATGLAVRAAGAGKRVVFAQFFKSGSSSEISVLQIVENIQTVHCKTVRGFWRRMDDVKKAQAREDYTKFLVDVIKLARDADLLVMDEIISACNHGTVTETVVLDFLHNKPGNLEVVLTGRNPSEGLLALADYVSEMQKIKHPYDCGIAARKGIEF
jgi:cob(I)alamin adenosyltransferase